MDVNTLNWFYASFHKSVNNCINTCKPQVYQALIVLLSKVSHFFLNPIIFLLCFSQLVWLSHLCHVDLYVLDWPMKLRFLTLSEIHCRFSMKSSHCISFILCLLVDFVFSSDFPLILVLLTAGQLYPDMMYWWLVNEVQYSRRVGLPHDWLNCIKSGRHTCPANLHINIYLYVNALKFVFYVIISHAIFLKSWYFTVIVFFHSMRSRSRGRLHPPGLHRTIQHALPIPTSLR